MIRFIHVIAKVIVERNKGKLFECMSDLAFLYFFVNLIEAGIEKLLFGESFRHLFDYVIVMFFLLLVAYTYYLRGHYLKG